MEILSDFDRKYSNLIRGLPASLRPIMAGLTFIGDPLIVIVIGFTGFVSALQRGQSAVEHAFIYSVIAFGLSTLLKLRLHRARPHGLIIKNLGINSYSFPSGHAFGTVIFYGQFAYLDIKYLTHPWNFVIAGLLSLVIFMIGISRVYLSAHYPSDVLGGWLLGLVSLVIITWLAY